MTRQPDSTRSSHQSPFTLHKKLRATIWKKVDGTEIIIWQIHATHGQVLIQAGYPLIQGAFQSAELGIGGSIVGPTSRERKRFQLPSD